MTQTQEPSFTDLVERNLSAEDETVKSLWRPIADEFDRDGPEIAKAYLDAERQRLEEKVQKLLDEFEGV